MIAFDTDVLSAILRGNAGYVLRVATIPLAEQAIPVIVAEEILRGRLNLVRQAEGGKASIAIDQAYKLLAEAIKDVRQFNILVYDMPAEIIFQEWRKQKLRGSTHDLRIAAICVVNSATLISRNRRDFEKIPGLLTEFWD